VSRAPSRRELLAGALGAGGLLVLGTASCDSNQPHRGFLGAMEGLNERLQRALFDPTRLAPELPESDQTPYDAFPQYKIGTFFPDPPASWSLRVGGMVEQPLTLSLDDLRRLPRTSLRVRHHCVEGWSAVASWQGVRVAELARAARLDPSARYVEFRSFEQPYYSSWDLESALHPQSVLAYGMDGEALRREHGAPLRVYSAVKLGYKMVKWVSEVLFLPERTGGYWEDQGYEWFAGV
jgi:DMSO/TMAO reductase YedYZ molybdopterin-dependent catalytic subunit